METSKGEARPAPPPKPRITGIKPKGGKQPPLPKRPPVGWKSSASETRETRELAPGHPNNSGLDAQTPAPSLPPSIPPSGSPGAQRSPLQRPTPPRPAARKPVISTTSLPSSDVGMKQPQGVPVVPSTDAKQNTKRVTPPMLQRLSVTRPEKRPKPATKPKPQKRTSLFYVSANSDEASAETDSKKIESVDNENLNDESSEVNHSTNDQNCSNFFVGLETPGAAADEAGQVTSGTVSHRDSLTSDVNMANAGEHTAELILSEHQNKTEVESSAVPAQAVGTVGHCQLNQEKQTETTLKNETPAAPDATLLGEMSQEAVSGGALTPLRPPRVRKGRKSGLASQESRTQPEHQGIDSATNGNSAAVQSATQVEGLRSTVAKTEHTQSQSKSQSNHSFKQNSFERSESVSGKKQPSRKAPPPPKRLRPPGDSPGEGAGIASANKESLGKASPVGARKEPPLTPRGRTKEDPSDKPLKCRDSSPGQLSSEFRLTTGGSSPVQPSSESHPVTTPAPVKAVSVDVLQHSPKGARGKSLENSGLGPANMGGSSTPGRLNMKNITANMGISISQGLQHQLTARTRPKPAPKPAPKPKPTTIPPKPSMRPAYKRENTSETHRYTEKKADAPLTIRAGSDDIRFTRNPSYSEALEDDTKDLISPQDNDELVKSMGQADSIIIQGVTTMSSSDSNEPQTVLSVADATVTSTDTDQPEGSEHPATRPETETGKEAPSGKAAIPDTIRVLPMDLTVLKSKTKPVKTVDHVEGEDQEKDQLENSQCVDKVKVAKETEALSPAITNLIDMPAMRKRSNTVEALLVVEKKESEAGEVQKVRRKSSSTTDLSVGGSQSNTLKKGKPIFVPPPPPPYSPGIVEKKDQLVQFPPLDVSMAIKTMQPASPSDDVFQAVADNKIAETKNWADSASLTGRGIDSDNEYEEVMVLDDAETGAKPDEAPPVLPPKQKIQKPPTPTETTPPRPKRRALRTAPPPPLSPPTTPPGPPIIPPRNRPPQVVNHQESTTTQRSSSQDVYDPQGYLEPLRDGEDGDIYSYADLPGFENSSPKKSQKTTVAPKPPLPPMETKPKDLPCMPPAESVVAGKRDSCDSFSSHSSHIYEPIGSRSGSFSMPGTPALGERRVSEGRSTFYFPADEEHKAEVESRSQPATPKSPKSPKFPNLDIEDIPEERVAKSEPPSETWIDIAIPPPQAPPRAKKKKTQLTRQTAEEGQQSGHSSDSDYIYPDDPDFVKRIDSVYHEANDSTIKVDDSVCHKADDPPVNQTESIYHEADDPPVDQTESIYHEADDPPVDQTESIYHEAEDSAIGSASNSAVISPTFPPPPVPPRDRRSEPAPHAIMAALERASSTVSDSRIVLERSASRSVQFNISPVVKSESKDSALGLSPNAEQLYEGDESDSEDSYIYPETEDSTKTGTIIPKQRSFTDSELVEKNSLMGSISLNDSLISDRPQSWGSSVCDYDDTVLPLQGKARSESGLSQASSFLDPGDLDRRVSSSSLNSELSDLSDMEMEESQQKKLEKRKKKLYTIAKEILSSEEAFVDVLKLLNLDFRTSIDQMTAKHDQAILPANVLNQILQYLPQLQNFNEELLKDIRHRIDNWEADPRIADIFLRKGPFLKMYTFYIREFENSIAAFDDARKKYPEFDSSVRQFEATPRCKNLQLKHYMLAPIQRIPRYRLLLQEYLKHLTPEYPDFKNTEAALVIVSEVADHANESMKYGDNFRKLWEIQSTLIGQFEVIMPGREFIKEGMLKKLSRKVMQPRMFFLFSDTLLYTTPVSGGYKLNSAIPLAGMRVSLPPTKEDFQNEFSILSTQRSFTISANTPEERDEWLEILKEAVCENMKRRSSFDVRKIPQTSSILVELDKDFKLGTRAPVWVPDARVSMCMLCTAEFSVTFRRHHCRACGKVVCGFCSDYRAPLRYLKYKAARVCLECYNILAKEVDEMDSVPIDIPGTPGDGDDIDSPFSKASIKSRFKGISWSSFRKASKAKRPAVLQEVHANDEAAEMSGYLKVWKSRRWKKLWFVLKGKALYTYKASEDAAAMESTVLLGYEVQTFSTWFEGVEPSLVFQISHRGTSAMVFRTESPASRDKWLHAMRDATIP